MPASSTPLPGKRPRYTASLVLQTSVCRLPKAFQQRKTCIACCWTNHSPPCCTQSVQQTSIIGRCAFWCNLLSVLEVPCCLQAGIFEPAPAEEDAIATTTGLLLNCINSGLYMANYNLILPPITEVCRHIGVKNSMVGIIVGACDIATVFGTVGELACQHLSPCMLHKPYFYPRASYTQEQQSHSVMVPLIGYR